VAPVEKAGVLREQKPNLRRGYMRRSMLRRTIGVLMRSSLTQERATPVVKAAG
jgi:hypothetical protein